MCDVTELHHIYMMNSQTTTFDLEGRWLKGSEINMKLKSSLTGSGLGLGLDTSNDDQPPKYCSLGNAW